MSRRDTTRTTSIQRRYARKLRGRFADINTEIRKGVRENDVFGLNDVTPVPDFTFPRDDQKVMEFRQWLDRQQENHVLETISDDSNRYVHQAYMRGVKNADIRMRRRGYDVGGDENIRAVVRTPIHQDKLQLMYTRNYDLLDGITDEVSKEISRELTDSLAEGINPRETARRLTDRVDSVGKHRATLMARTETLNAHNEASLQRYSQHGIEKVDMLVSNPCPECEAIKSGAPYRTEDVSGVIPVHPQCVCSWTPVIDT